MLNNNTSITDPAMEIAGFFSILEEFDLENRVTYVVMADYFSFDVASPEWFALLGVLSGRIFKFIKFVDSIDDPLLTTRTRRQIIQSAESLNTLFAPTSLNQGWQITKSNIIRDNDIGRIEQFSSIARKYKPLRLLTTEEVDQLVAEIDELTPEILVAEDIPEWCKQTIFDGFTQLKFTLKHIKFFGHDIAVEKLVLLYTQVQSISEHVDKSGNEPKNRRIGTTLYHMTTVVLAVAGLFSLPNGINESLSFYRDDAIPWIMGQHQDIIEQSELFKPQRQIEHQPEEKKGSEKNRGSKVSAP